MYEPQKAAYRHPKYKTAYRVKNWPEYKKSLRNRGDITVWFSQDAIEVWTQKKNGKRGGQSVYSDIAIETSLSLRLVYHLPLRQTEGFLGSLLRLMELDLPCPDHTARGMRYYHKYLALFTETDPVKMNQIHRNLCRGWYIGTQSGKKAIMKDVSEGLIGVDSDPGLNRFGVEGAAVLLSHGLACLGKTESDLHSDRKGAPWKVSLAAWIKSRCGVNNQWISDYLHMGNIYNISRMISSENKRAKKRDKTWKKLRSAQYKAPLSLTPVELGQGTCPSSGQSAARTTWVMDQLLQHKQMGRSS